MHDVTRAELFKLTRRPAVWVLLAAAAVLNQVFAYLIPYLSYRSDSSSEGVPPDQLLAGTLPDQLLANTIGAFPVFAGALALVFGALVSGGEHGWGTVKTLLTQRPGRASVAGGQLLALAVALFAGTVLLFAAGALTTTVIAFGEDQAMDWPGLTSLVAGFAVGWLVLLVWAVIGAVIGVLLRGVALPIGLGVVWILGIENLLSAMADSMLTALEPVRDLLPGVNAGSLVSAVLPESLVEPPPGVTSSVGDTRALVTLACYLVVCTAVAVWTTRRRDVA